MTAAILGALGVAILAIGLRWLGRFTSFTFRLRLGERAPRIGVSDAWAHRRAEPSFDERRGVDGDTFITSQRGPTAHREAAVNIGYEAGSEPADAHTNLYSFTRPAAKGFQRHTRDFPKGGAA
jgi:hypothetical protein